jgi:hypothetical protein
LRRGYLRAAHNKSIARIDPARSWPGYPTYAVSAASTKADAVHHCNVKHWRAVTALRRAREVGSYPIVSSYETASLRQRRGIGPGGAYASYEA